MSGKLEALRFLVAEPFSGFGLTDRQAEIARLAAFGLTIGEIALRVGLTPGGVGSHLRDVKRRTGLGTHGLTRSVFDRIEEVLFK